MKIKYKAIATDIEHVNPRWVRFMQKIWFIENKELYDDLNISKSKLADLLSPNGRNKLSTKMQKAAFWYYFQTRWDNSKAIYEFYFQYVNGEYCDDYRCTDDLKLAYQSFLKANGQVNLLTVRLISRNEIKNIWKQGDGRFEDFV